jgi:hypothetical protein
MAFLVIGFRKTYSKECCVKSIAPMLEQELEGAVEIKDRSFLHRYITLMAENFVQKEEHVTEAGSVRSDIQVLAESMKLNFERVDKRFENMLLHMEKRFEAVDKRFEAVDKRFEDVNNRFDDVNKRFTMMFSFVTIGFILVSTLITVYQFLG